MGRRRKPGKVKADAKRPLVRNSPKDSVGKVNDPETRLEGVLGQLHTRDRELAEALEQQTATAEILHVIRTSPTDVQPVFDTIVRSAVRLCDGLHGFVGRFDGELIHFAAQYNYTPEALQMMQRMYPRRPDRTQAAGRAILTGDVVSIADVQADTEYATDLAVAGGWRSILNVPMLREGKPIGTIGVIRGQAGRFSDAQVELLRAFADQAVIAIENVRLFKELEVRNRDLTEALGQQTATSEILSVISSSPTDVQPVFEAIAQSATRLCEGARTLVCTFDGELIHLAAYHNATPAALESARTDLFPLRPRRELPFARAILDRTLVHVPDVDLEPGPTPEFLRQARVRSALCVPLLRASDAIGVIAISRSEPRPFSEQQVELLRTFADQAVIAIENVRLFEELGARNRDLTEALDQQTATAEILRTIAHAQSDAQPVFDTIVRSAARLCKSVMASVLLTDGRMLYLPANYGSSPEALAAVRARFPIPLDSSTVSGAAILTRSVVNVPDVEDPSVVEFTRQAARVLGYRSLVTVPMRREGEVVGAINVCRREPGRFSDVEVALLRSFADQAVIAIENVRLFTELEARTGELTRLVKELKALGEVGQAVSSSLDLPTVLATIVSRSVGLSGAEGGAIYEYDEAGEEFYLRATDGLPDEYVQIGRQGRKGEGATGRLAFTHAPVEVPDIAAPGVYESRTREVLIRHGHRALLAVPLLREDRILGSLVVFRKTAGQFGPEVVALLQAFATQSALAIQNARLFREIEHKSRQVEAASRHKSEFLANMSHELRTPLNAIIGYSELLEEEAAEADAGRLVPDLQKIAVAAKHQLSLINDILDLSKVEAGRMELEVADFDLPTAIDDALTLVRERAARRGIALGSTLDRSAGSIRADERKVKQVLLNLLSNALKFTPEGGRIDVRAAMNEGIAEISVADTGVGIAPEDQEAVFEEFRQVGTADKKVEGTGLGLALCRRFVELHGGQIWVKSQPGQGSTFAFTLPVCREG